MVEQKFESKKEDFIREIKRQISKDILSGQLAQQSHELFASMSSTSSMKSHPNRLND